MTVSSALSTAADARPEARVGGPARAAWRLRQRRIHRGWVAAGVLLIVLSALGSAAMFRALGPAQEYLAVSADVPAGAPLGASDLMVVRLNSTPGLSMVPAGDVDRVLGSYAAVPLTAGTLVSPAQLTDQRVPAPGEQLVALPLSRHDLPGGALAAGDPVLLVATGGQSAAGAGSGSGEDGQPPMFDATVHEVRATDGRGSNVVVSVLVPDRDGPAVAALAASGRVAVVRVAEQVP